MKKRERDTMKFTLFLATILLGTSSFAAQPFFNVSRSKPEDYRLLGKQKAAYEVRGNKLIVSIPPDPADRWPGVILKPQHGKYFDISGYSVIAVDVRNLNPHPAKLQMEAVELGKPEFKHQAAGGIGLNPGEKATLRLRCARAGNTGVEWAPRGLLVTFDGFDEMSQHLDAKKVEQLRFFIKDPEVEQKFELSNFRLEDPSSPLPAALESKRTFYPCIDRFGQYRHGEWPNKVHNEAELVEYAASEAADLAAHPGPADRTCYGGWAAGPDFTATGNFYPVKYKGKWYLVDPAGKLFWSLGMNEVSLDCQGVSTGLALRKHYFEKLPDDKAAKWCYSINYPGLRWYKEKGVRKTKSFSFVRSNLLLKDGGSKGNVLRAFYDRAPKRLKSWGFNTIGAWSNENLTKQNNKIPYAFILYTDVKKIEGDSGWWGKFPDVFDPDFEGTVAANIKRYHASRIKDPYCIGFFINNELSWGRDDTKLARGVLLSPPDQPSKIAFANRLKKKYKSAEALNQAWGSNYSTWENFLATTKLPDEKRARTDLVVFNSEIIERYFSKLRETIKTLAPHKLYLGCRFAMVGGFNENVVRIAAKYVDVLSFNLYQYSVATFRLPKGVDKPVLIGEWHFGTMQYGPPSPGLCSTADQIERARAFDRYLRSALWNPNIVGAHYFAYYDQPATGRPGDGENMQIGFLSVADVPYPEMVEAARKLSAELYRTRVNSVAKGR